MKGKLGKQIFTSASTFYKKNSKRLSRDGLICGTQDFAYSQ
jgi:hypothetical protein